MVERRIGKSSVGGSRVDSGGRGRRTRRSDGSIVNADGVPMHLVKHEPFDVPPGLNEAIKSGKPLDAWLRGK